MAASTVKRTRRRFSAHHVRLELRATRPTQPARRGPCAVSPITPHHSSPASDCAAGIGGVPRPQLAAGTMLVVGLEADFTMPNSGTAHDTFDQSTPPERGLPVAGTATNAPRLRLRRPEAARGCAMGRFLPYRHDLASPIGERDRAHSQLQRPMRPSARSNVWRSRSSSTTDRPSSARTAPCSAGPWRRPRLPILDNVILRAEYQIIGLPNELHEPAVLCCHVVGIGLKY